jgi:hypothetical protein
MTVETAPARSSLGTSVSTRARIPPAELGQAMPARRRVASLLGRSRMISATERGTLIVSSGSMGSHADTRRFDGRTARTCRPRLLQSSGAYARERTTRHASSVSPERHKVYFKSMWVTRSSIGAAPVA